MLLALITGANSGVGLALAERLLSENLTPNGDHLLSLCLGCRSIERAGHAREQILSKYPKALIELLLIDISSVASVEAASREVLERFPRLDMLFLNAGIMPATGVNWTAVFKPSLKHFLR